MKIKIYGKVADEATQKQIESISKNKALEHSNIAIMPDNHLGKGACIGFTATFEDKIIPNLVGVDVGCGVAFYEMPNWFNDSPEHLLTLQKVIRKHIPHGNKVNKEIPGFIHPYDTILVELDELTFELTNKQVSHILNSIGTLGSGNHFISIEKSEKLNKLFLVVHTGSRNLGQLVAKHHQELAEKNFVSIRPSKEEIENIDPKLRGEFIANYNKKLVNDTPEKGLEYLVGDQVDDYLNDMQIAQNYAWLNRQNIVEKIVDNLAFDLNVKDSDLRVVNHTIHNYIDIENKIIRKGAIFADENNDFIIPLNMRDGSIIGRGKGNKEANFSAPHGAGRIMSRNVAKEKISLEDFKETMKDIKSWTVNKNTIDEAPFAYKDKEEIIEGIKELVEIKDIIKPVFNFKDDSNGGRE